MQRWSWRRAKMDGEWWNEVGGLTLGRRPFSDRPGPLPKFWQRRLMTLRAATQNKPHESVIRAHRFTPRGPLT